ncbi:MAG TPA: PPOX class F420-dependent oxidoreductase [Acidimicrobiales bacterium]|jgi:PPOX class probable F420-dependent enzyme|nr:PPOX class F420-dependent oxidoreductase [Acidimicrobiales bacterium]
MELDAARTFLRDHARSVLATRRGDGGPQMSPVTHAVDDQGRVIISSRETAYKVRNLRRDPRASLCVVSDGWYGDWIQVDGTATIVSLPDAMDILVDYYRRLRGEHPDWDEYREAMTREKRCIVQLSIERAGPDRRG